jgi:membrane protease YdiL (CAAX protease family)
VVGLALAAVYLRNNSIAQVVFVHFLIDFTNRLYLEQTTSASYVQIAIFVVLLVAETAYAVWLTVKGDKG